MHGSNASVVQQILAGNVRRAGPGAGFRNLLPSPKVLWDGKPEKRLFELLPLLAAKIMEHHPDDGPTNVNRHLPSGYTYLLQLIAHDLVDSTVPLSALGGASFGFANGRVTPLCLDTIYGGGPDVCPQAYQFDHDAKVRYGKRPRMFLRVGRIKDETGFIRSAATCPFRDIGRGVAADVPDTGLTTEVPDPSDPSPNPRLILSDHAIQNIASQDQAAPAPDGGRLVRIEDLWRSEALIADPRNDDHALISQMTVLFHLLHNHILGRLRERLSGVEQDNDAYKHLMLTRLIVAMIYRNIIARDVLKLILDPAVYRRYADDAAPLVAAGDGIPVEFSHGAVRFAHAMIRDTYNVNRRGNQEILQALIQSSRRDPSHTPITSTWLVDWSLFFDPAAEGANFSRRLGPSYASSLASSDAFGLPNGLAERDLLSAAYAQPWSVPALSDALHALGLDMLPPSWHAAWDAPLHEWLGTPDLQELAVDPPLPFFVLFEAQCAGRAERLGPFGSVIVAETIFAALRQRLPFEQTYGLQDRIAAACDGVIGKPDVLADLATGGEIETMSQLLAFMIRVGALPAAPTG